MITLFTSKKFFHWCGSFLLVLTFLVMSYSTSVIIPNKTEKAEAWSDVPAIAQRAAVAAYDWVIAKAQQIDQWIQTNKEMVLDGLAWNVVNVILEKMSQDIIKWINSGFKGQPAFVQNPEEYFIGIADRVVGDAIWGTDFKFLCSPFALDIKIALELQYVNGRGPDYQYTSQCTLSGVIDNVDNFFAGDFLSSGWKGWMEVTTKPQNNPIGAMALGSMHLNAKLDSKIKAKSEALSWGRGIMSTEVCNEIADESGGHTKCEIVTPGVAIQDQLSKTLGIPADRLTVADEFNEIISALFNQLVITAFNQAGGLLGLTESNVAGASGTGTYFRDLANQNRTISGSETDSIVKALAFEKRYLPLNTALLEKIVNVKSYKNTSYGEMNSCHSGALNQTLAAMENDLETTIRDIQDTITRLEEMLIEYTVIESDVNLSKSERLIKQAEISIEFAALQGENKIHSEADIGILEIELARKIDEAISAFKQEVDAACIFIDTGGGGGGDAF